MKQNHPGDKRLQNKLWIARKHAGYLQKWVASILGQRSLSVISEYEKGRKLPSLRTALKLSFIYKTPLPELFPILYAELTREVEEARLHHAPVRKRDEEFGLRETRDELISASRDSVPAPSQTPFTPGYAHILHSENSRHQSGY